MEVVNNRYHIVKMLGKGGMGNIYLAKDRLNNNRHLALKKIKKDTINDTPLVGFKHEFEIMTRLRHPNLIRVYDFGRDNATDEYYITMEYLMGYSLKHILDKGHKLDRNTVITLMIHVCRAITFIHTRNILHRDIKPANIIITVPPSSYSPDDDLSAVITAKNQQVKVMDFGLADLLDSVDQISHKSKGTIAYLAPDVLKKTIDKRTDIYALGITFYELIAGKTFHTTTNSQHIIKSLMDQSNLNEIKHQRLQQLDTPELSFIIDKMTAYDPVDRYDDCSQIIMDINRLLGTSYKPETPETREAYILGAGFVGRAHETARLKAHLTVKTEIPKALWVEGEAGVGKSRLFAEFKKYCQLHTIRFLTGDCRRDRYLSPFIPILEELLLHASDEQIEHYGPELVKIIRHHERLKNIAPSSIQDPRVEQQTIIKTITAFINATCCAEDEPTLIYFNDLHVADDTSVKVIDELISTITSGNYPKIYISSRKEGTSALETMHTNTVIDLLHLSPFDEKTVVHYIEAIFGKNTIGSRLKQAIPAIWQKVGGNPFYLQELIKTIVISEQLDYVDSSWDLTENFSEGIIPDNITNLVLLRLNNLSLSREQWNVLETINLMQRPIGYAELHAVIPFEYTLLTYLADNEIIVGSVGDTGIEYKVAHDLISDTITGRIAHKKELHELIAERLEAIHRDETDEYIDELAKHYFNAGNTEKAAFYLEQAEVKARNNYENKKALTLLNSLLSIIGNAVPEKKIDILLDKGKVLEFLGDYEKSKDIALEAEQLAEQCGDKVRCAKANDLLSFVYDMLEDAGQFVIDASKKALRLYRETGDKVGECAMLASLGFINIKSNQKQALTYLEEGLQIALTYDLKDLIAKHYDYLSRLHWRRGEFEKAIMFLEKCIALNEKIGAKKNSVIAYILLAITYGDMKNYHEALSILEKTKAIAEEIEFTTIIILSLLLEVEFEIFLNHIDRAKKLLHNSKEYLQENMIISYDIMSKIFQARIYADSGQKDKAVGILRALLDAGKNHKEIDYITELNYELWTLTGEEIYRIEALKILNSRNNESPAFYYTERINLLNTASTGRKTSSRKFFYS